MRWGVLPISLCVLLGAAVPHAQSVSIRVDNNALRVRAPEFRFIAGETLQRLKDGRSVRLAFTLALLGRSGGSPLAQTKRSCDVTYDLWEERFALSADTTPARAISHVTASDAEAWCVDQIAVPLGPPLLGSDQAFWIRLTYDAQDRDSSPSDAPGFSVRGLIDRLSRRTVRRASDAMQAGPFRLPR